MSKGFCLLAQNNASVDYVRQAYSLAVSIHKFNKDQSISLITNDPVLEKYQSVFDNIIPIPWTDQAEDTEWKIENRWKVYHVSPYEHTIVMDVDMLVLHDITHWWAELQKRDMFFVSNVRDYRDKIVTSRVYRKTFDENTLPNLYSGIYYFKKSTTAHAFFNFLEIVMTNWELFYGKFAGTCYQDWCSFDLSCSIVSKLLDNTLEITDPNSFITFTHMKPHCQGWNEVPDKWTNVLGSYITKDKTMIIGNYLQRNVLHYVEPEFLTNKVIKHLEEL
jgi:hypothetical protein|tara:strand:- start:347 stop:1174 length:828 start_codon:yes stop_codon:yes gene_type:complete